MDADGQRGERGGRREQFTDEEYAFLRRARFGELPARVAPEDLVEMAETDAPNEDPPEPVLRPDWYLAGGAV